MYLPPYCVMFVEDASQNLSVVRMCVDPPEKFSGYANKLKLFRISTYAMVISLMRTYLPVEVTYFLGVYVHSHTNRAYVYFSCFACHFFLCFKCFTFSYSVIFSLTSQVIKSNFLG